MRFANPEYLWLLLLAGPVVLYFVLINRWRLSRLKKFATGNLDSFRQNVNIHRRWASDLLWLFTFVLLILSLAQPQWGQSLEEIERSGIDIFFIMDTSRSMAVEDAAPNRLRQSVHAAGTLLNKVAGNRVGLITFAGEPTVQCPLTLDHAAVRLFLEPLNVESVPVPGTSLAAALKFAISRFEATEDPDRAKTIVIFSDGEDHEGALDEAQEQLANAGVQVFAIGVGTTRGGPIPLRDEKGDLLGYKKNSEDQIVTSSLAEVPLRELAQQTGGRFYALSPAENEIDELARDLSAIQGSLLETPWSREFKDRYQWTLGFALLCLFGQGMISERKRGLIKGVHNG